VGKLIFVGKLDTGFPQDVERDLLARLGKLGPLSKPPFALVPPEYLKRAVSVRLELVVEGEFTTWTTISCARRRSRGAGGQVCEGGGDGEAARGIIADLDIYLPGRQALSTTRAMRRPSTPPR
jgi:hypothetical protein